MWPEFLSFLFFFLLLSPTKLSLPVFVSDRKVKSVTLGPVLHEGIFFTLYRKFELGITSAFTSTVRCVLENDSKSEGVTSETGQLWWERDERGYCSAPSWGFQPYLSCLYACWSNFSTVRSILTYSLIVLTRCVQQRLRLTCYFFVLWQKSNNSYSLNRCWGCRTKKQVQTSNNWINFFIK